MGTIRHPRVKTRGFTLIELLIVISIILVIIAIAIPNGQKMLQGAREAAVTREIVSIHQAETQYYSQFGKYAANLVQLGPPLTGTDGPEAANIIPKGLADGKKNGYVYSVAATPVGYTITAVPDSANSGRRTFYSDQTLVIRNNWGLEPATAASDAIK